MCQNALFSNVCDDNKWLYLLWILWISNIQLRKQGEDVTARILSHGNSRVVTQFSEGNFRAWLQIKHLNFNCFINRKLTWNYDAGYSNKSCGKKHNNQNFKLQNVNNWKFLILKKLLQLKKNLYQRKHYLYFIQIGLVLDEPRN